MIFTNTKKIAELMGISRKAAGAYLRIHGWSRWSVTGTTCKKTVFYKEE